MKAGEREVRVFVEKTLENENAHALRSNKMPRELESWRKETLRVEARAVRRGEVKLRAVTLAR